MQARPKTLPGQIISDLAQAFAVCGLFAAKSMPATDAMEREFSQAVDRAWLNWVLEGHNIFLTSGEALATMDKVVEAVASDIATRHVDATTPGDLNDLMMSFLMISGSAQVATEAGGMVKEMRSLFGTVVHTAIEFKVVLKDVIVSEDSEEFHEGAVETLIDKLGNVMTFAYRFQLDKAETLENFRPVMQTAIKGIHSAMMLLVPNATSILNDIGTREIQQTRQYVTARCKQGDKFAGGHPDDLAKSWKENLGDIKDVQSVIDQAQRLGLLNNFRLIDNLDMHRVLIHSAFFVVVVASSS